MRTLAFLTLVTGLFINTSCKKNQHDMDHMNTSKPKNINYPAAYVVNGKSNSISVIDLSSNEVKETIALGETSDPHHGTSSTGISWPHHVYLSPDKTKLAIGVPGMDLSAGHGGGMSGMSGKIAVVNAVDGAIIKVLDLPVMNHNAIYSPDGTEIWTTQMEEMGKVLVYDANTFQLKNTIAVKMHPAEVTFSSNGSKVFVANGGSDTVTVINPSDKSVVGQIKVGEDPVGAWTGSDGKMYVDNEHGQSISIINTAGNDVEQTIDLGFMPGMAAYNGANKELWVSDPVGGKIHYWTYTGTTWTQGGSIVTGAGAHAIAFTSNANYAYVTNQEAANVSVIRVSDHTKIKDISVGEKPNGIAIKE